MSVVPRWSNPALDCVIRKGLYAVLSSDAARGSVVPLGFGLGNVDFGSLEFFTSIFNVCVEFMSSPIVIWVNRLSLGRRLEPRICTFSYGPASGPPAQCQ